MKVFIHIADMKLLIVDDSPLIRNRIAKQAMKLKGISVVGEAADGESALEKFKELDPDFTILDIHLPDINGLEVLRRIRNQNPTTTICMLTNFDIPQYKTFSYKYGADFFLSKVDDFEKLKNILAEEAEKMEAEESSLKG